MPVASSFPLMRLAREAGVDYGEVLLVAGGYRAAILRQSVRHRESEVVAVLIRWSDALTGERCAMLVTALQDHAKARWRRSS